MYLETITLDSHPVVRFEVSQDTDAEDPREWLTRDVQILSHVTPWRHARDDAEREANTRTMEAFGRVFSATGDDDHALEVAQRYARTFEPDMTIETFSLRGYSQSDWQDIVVTVPSDGSHGSASGHARVFGQWAYGDVYTVTEQRPHIWHDGDGNDLTTWDDVDSLSGIYADSAEEAAEYYAAEHLPTPATA